MYFDVLLDSLPDPIDPADPPEDTQGLWDSQNPLAENGIYAIVEVPYKDNNKNKFFYHCQMTQEQLDYWLADGSKVLKSARKADKKWFKELEKDDGETDIVPLHVFGDHMVDFEAGEIIYPNTKPNENTSTARRRGGDLNDTQRE